MIRNYKKQNKCQIRSILLLYYISIIFLVIFTSCKNKDLNKRNGDPIFLTGKSLKMDFDLFSDSFTSFIDSTFFMDAPIGLRDSLINVYQINGDSLIAKRRLISQGNGPFEGFIISTFYNKENQQLFFFENHGILRDGYQINVSNGLENIYNTALWKKLDFSKIQKHRIGHSYSCLNDSLLIVIGGVYEKPTILTIINLYNQETTPIEFWIDNDKNTNTLIKQAVYMDEAKIYYNKILDKFLYVCGSGEYVELFQLNHYNAVNRKTIFNILPNFEILPDMRNYRSKTNFKHRGFKTSVTDDYIYLRKEEYTTDRDFALQSYKGYPYYYNDIIDVFDWDGNFIKSYHLDMPFFDLLVDPIRNVIYVTTIDLTTDESIIREYLIQ